VAAALGNRAILNHENLVGVANRRKPVRDDQRRTRGHRFVEGALHCGLALGVEVRRGLIEDHQVRCLQQEARQCNSLFLAAREPIAPLAHHRGESERQRRDEVVDLGGAQRGVNLFVGRVRLREHQIRAQRVVKEVRVLRDDAHHGVERRRRRLTNVDAVDRDRPAVGVVEARDQHRNRRLTGATVANEGGHSARCDAKRDVVQHVGARRVVESGDGLE